LSSSLAFLRILTFPVAIPGLAALPLSNTLEEIFISPNSLYLEVFSVVVTGLD